RAGFHRVLFDIQSRPRVSIVIPSAGRIVNYEGRRIDLARMCVGSILQKSTWPDIEIVLIHNNDLRPDLEAWLSERTVLVPYTNPVFNLAEKINIGARRATGEHLIILNDDTEVLSRDWIEHMLRYSQQPSVGAVGAKLLFPNNRIQHAGVLLLNGTPGHPYYNHPSDEIGYFLSVQLPRNYVAVTGACMMTRHELWDTVGGFSEDFPLNYNDVDYCLKVREQGCRTVYVPEAELYHYESVSREAAGGVKPGELEHFQTKWMDRYYLDPYYNPNLPADYPYYYAD
ncbi:MAG TPA: glycosyltransferase family 2 protein, partial [Bryobacteraceae bacterium]|nr:glycosyltransferase family 2 protein [Bryobacteraceae bacterium]